MSRSRGVKVVEGRRLAWYDAEPNEDHWLAHWRGNVTPAYYSKARGALDRDELGKVLRRVFPPGGRVLEAGCGAGWYVAALEGAGYDVDGIEYAKELVDLVNAVEPHLPVRWADATALDEPDGSYASYLSIGVVEHRQAGPEPFLQEAVRLLEPGGRAVITVPSFGPLRRLKARLGRYETSPPDAPFFQYGFRSEELVELVSAAGLRVDEACYQGPLRLMLEEVPGYRAVFLRRGGERVRQGVDRLIGRRDGHMAIVVATKPR